MLLLDMKTASAERWNFNRNLLAFQANVTPFPIRDNVNLTTGLFFVLDDDQPGATDRSTTDNLDPRPGPSMNLFPRKMMKTATQYFFKFRKHALSAKEIKESLELLLDGDVCPEVSTSPIVTFLASINDKVFSKRPKLNLAFEGTGLLFELLLQEAQLMKILLRNPHPNIIRFHGCLTRRRRIVGLVLDRYDMTLKQRLERDMIGRFDVENFVTQIKSATVHLHSLGLAHNDLNPMNIMVNDENDMLFLIDFGSCQPFGSTLITAGTPGWNDEDYTTPAKKHDMIALDRLTSWLYTLKDHGQS
ncbi:kinase-like protein [Polychaeton citri CBS 116435]|uniref:Kinase-like protein n=1 Tax=Polychaeton citri CBS 116435 TaxID=1314669 RepID=A0A9P4QEJ9_9PEZI|nr:kinase-like protein [Polychaeton citri CBS 116435]